jgi:PAS domain S-box-containing protein
MNLIRRFSIMCAAVMAVLALVLGFLVTRTYEINAIEKAKGDLARIIQDQAGNAFSPSDFSEPVEGPEKENIRERFIELSKIPDSLLTIVFSPAGIVVWSTDEDLIGKRYEADHELKKALTGRVTTKITAPYKEEHGFKEVKEIIEIYIPIRLGDPARVAGVVEIYQDMAPLRSSILKTNIAVSGTLLAGFGTLYVLLFGMLRRGNRLIERNREALRLSQGKVQWQRIELLKRIGASAIEGTDVDALLKEATGDVCGMLELPRCTIRLFGDPDKVVEHREEGYPSSASLFPVSPRPEDSKEIREKGGTLVVDDVRGNSLFAGNLEELARIRLGAYIGVPLWNQEGLIGALFLDRAEPHAWTEDEVQTAEAVARQIAVAVRHARLFDTHQELAGRLVTLMDNVPGVVYRGLRDWSMVFAGAGIVRLTGYPAKDFLSRSVLWRDLIHPDDLEMVKSRFREAVKREEKILRVEYRILHRDGEIRWLADRRQLAYDAQGGFAYVDGLLLDITNRKQAEEALRLTQFAVDRAGDAAYWVKPDGSLIYVNEQACRVLGYSREELLSMTIHDVNPEFPPQVWATHWEDLRRRKSYTMETRHRAKDGRIIPVEVNVNYVEFDGKEYNCASARDISERVRALERSRQLEAQLLQSQKMEAIGSLAGGIAHDFNNLLTGILGYANLLKSKAEPGSEVSRAAEVIQDAADRASQLTAQLLGFARKGKHLAVPVSIHKTIDGVAGLLERTMDKRIRIRKSFAHGSLAVDGDPTQLQQFILNLAMNARDAMPGGGEMTISTGIEDLDEAYCGSHPGATPGRYVRIEVADTGVGIPQSHLEKIFDPFFTTKEQGKGTGLGLSMVFGIVKNHGGYIEVDSKVGAGSRFKVYLPPSSAEAEAEEPDSPPATHPGRGRGRILLIDDQETVRDVCAAMLQNLGYTVSMASDGREGVEHYRRYGKDIDLVIVDMVMPNLGGRECFLQIKAMNPEVRAVLSTGFSMDGAVQEIMKEGITGFIQKPYRLEQLSRVVAKSMGRDPGRHPARRTGTAG